MSRPTARSATAAPLVLLTAIALMTPPAHAGSPGPGDLDDTFNNTGIVITDMSGTGGSDSASALLIQANGRILIVGNVSAGDQDAAAARYDEDGSPDLSFGGGTGREVLSLTNQQIVHSVVRSGTRTLVGGTNFGDFFIVALDNQGAIDTSGSWGGSDGIVTTVIGEGAVINALAVQADGKIVAAGAVGPNNAHDFAVARYLPNGNLDTTFSTDGVATTDFGGADDQGFALVLQPNGKILQGGGTGVGAAERFALVRYLENGKRDPAYGDGGRVTTNVGPSADNILALARQPDGNVVAAGFAGNGISVEEGDFALVRYTTSGAEDHTFGGGDGEVTTEFPGGTSTVFGVAIQASGKIVAVGVLATIDGNDFALARYKPDGSLNGSFGDGGLVVTEVSGANDPDAAAAVAIQPDGKIVVAGSSGEDAAVTRYLSA